jgi:hypothetical protein
MKKYCMDSKGERNILHTTIVRCDITVVLVEYIIQGPAVKPDEF